MRHLFLHLLILFSALNAISQIKNETPQAFDVRTTEKIHIDGDFESAWDAAKPISGFTQFKPYYKALPYQSTEIRILYDDYHIYIAASMYDKQADSILLQLGNRDDEPNADALIVEFDTYNNKQDAYVFTVYASGVQADSRHADDSYNAVWQSAVKIKEDGWHAEICIPYSAIRFPRVETQNWGMQLTRSIRRIREFDQWSLEKQGTDNKKYQWGKLSGIESIKPPIRLSFLPYFSSGIQHYPYNVTGKSNLTFLFSGGADLKYGINQSFTLDVSLMPDFTQVQSDNKVKNLSAFETTYSEQRPFFNEAIDLFTKGGLFYSRRIGRTPQAYYTINNQLKSGEKVLDNPVQAPLINASKISGRTSSGLGIGVFNAITNSTYATVEDSNRQQRKILTEPLSNYNIFVIDQSFRNNSNLYLINTNVSRAGGYSDANVTGSGGQIMNRKQTYKIRGAAFFNHIRYGSLDSKQGIKDGLRYEIGAGKSSGRLQFWLSRLVIDKNYDINDMGVSFRNDEVQHEASVAYSTFNPWWKLLNFSNKLIFFNRAQYSSGKNLVSELSNNVSITGLNYLSIWQTTKFGLTKEIDFYEARKPRFVYYWPRYSYGHLGFSSDYRKPFALDGQVAAWINTEQASELSFFIQPIFRIGDKLRMIMRWRHLDTYGQKGFAESRNDSIIFGRRDIRLDENTLNLVYIFKNNLSVNLRFRHYWNRGTYKDYFLLDNDGQLNPYYGNTANNDYDFNSFNVDMVFSWEFSPGSNLTIVWKNELLQEKISDDNPYFQKLYNTFDAPQFNTISFKILYYIDYLSIRKQIALNMLNKK